MIDAKKEKALILEAEYNILKATAAYANLMEKQMETSDGSTKQMESVHEGLRALNHITVALERLYRILHGTEPGKAQTDMEDGKRKALFVPCPHCGKMTLLSIRDLRWDEGEPETAQYICRVCGRRITETDRDAMLERGEWVENTGEETPTNALYMKGVPFSAVVRALKGAFGDQSAMERFVNFWVGNACK